MRYIKEYLFFKNETPIEESDELLKYLSIKFKKNITKLKLFGTPVNTNSYLFEYDQKRVLKIEKQHVKRTQKDFSFFNYLIENSNKLPIAKIYNIGFIDIPHKFLTNNNKKHFYLIMEKVTIDDELMKNLMELYENGMKLVTSKTELKFRKYANDLITLIPRLMFSVEKEAQEDILKIRESYQNHPLESFVNEFIDIFEKLKNHNIHWSDVHEYQFGRNNKGELVAIDLDGFKNLKYKNPNIKTHIKENKKPN